MTIKKHKYLISFLCIFLFFGQNLYSFANDESTKIEKAKIKIRALLRDPDSSKFQNLKVSFNSKANEIVCGEVNARNAFGGYTGYSKFNVSIDKINIVSIDKLETIKSYNLSGCAGPDAELEARLENEALFNCNVIWNLISNTIVEKQSQTEAIEAAIIATNNRAKDNGVELNEIQIQMIRSQYQQSLEQTISNKKQVRLIRKNTEYQKKMFILKCSSNTINALKEQIK